LLRDESYTYLADFGIAKLQDESSGLTQVGTVIGTPEYMAPELLEEPASPGSDIYALGIVLYQMLTGRVPFAGKTTLAVLQKHAHEPPVRPSLINPAILPALEQVILGAIEKDPRRRFQTPEELAQAYKQALLAATANQEAVIAPPLILRSPTGTIVPSASQATVQTPLQTARSVPPYAPHPKHPLSPSHRLVGVGIGAVILLLVLVLLLPNLLGNGSNNQGQPPAPSPTSTTADHTCDNQPQVTITDTANVLNTPQICHAVKTWPYTLVISTTTQDGNLSDQASALLTNANTIVIVIGIAHSDDHQKSSISIIGGASVQISDAHYQRARAVFTKPANAGDYTHATIAVIEALQSPDQKQKQHGNGENGNGEN